MKTVATPLSNFGSAPAASGWERRSEAEVNPIFYPTRACSQVEVNPILESLWVYHLFCDTTIGGDALTIDKVTFWIAQK